jgi:hypothetical protein
MTNISNTMQALGFEHLHVNDMGLGCVVLWQRTAGGEQESLVVDVAQLEQALQYLRRLHGPTYFLRRAANDLSPPYIDSSSDCPILIASDNLEAGDVLRGYRYRRRMDPLPDHLHRLDQMLLDLNGDADAMQLWDLELPAEQP